MQEEGTKVLLGVTGGIAAYKACELVRRLRDAGAQVQAVLTASATRFVAPMTFQALTGREAPVELFDADREHRISHIELARWADVVLIAPATADFLAKMAHGRGDDLLSTLLLATRCPVVVVPAMNTAMWNHPATVSNLRTLRSFPRHRVVPPDEGSLACGETGAGRMPDPPIILEAVRAARCPQDLVDRKVVVTAGPTREAVDVVRFLSNRSTGRMGFALARAARARGAEVTLISGPTDLPDPPGAEVVRVVSAEDMRQAVFAALPDADCVIKAAAVADARPPKAAADKLRKGDLGDALALERTADILAELGARREGSRPLLVGFAAETSDPDTAGPAKLDAKGCDLIVVNRVDEPGSGFGAATNRVTIFDCDGGREALPMMDKDSVADRICARIADRLSPP